MIKKASSYPSYPSHKAVLAIDNDQKSEFLSFMLTIRHNPGFIISGIFHILILAVPISFAVVQKYEDIELFVMTDEPPTIQTPHIKKREKAEEVKQKIVKEIPPVVEPQMTKENIQVKEEKIIESVTITEKIAVTALPLGTANPPSSGMQEGSPVPQIISREFWGILGTVYLIVHVFLFLPRLLPPQNTGDQSFHSLQKGFIS